MMNSSLLLNAARAFALVSYSDGELSPAEQERFGKLVASDRGLPPAGWAEVGAVWSQAVSEVTASPSFGAPLAAIRSEVKDDADKATIMRMAQAAIVADEKIEAQESGAIRLLAEALGLDPEAY